MSISPISKKLSEFVKQDLLDKVPGTSATPGFGHDSANFLKSVYDSLIQTDHKWETEFSDIRELGPDEKGHATVSSYIPDTIRNKITSDLKNRRVFVFGWGARTIKIHMIYSGLSNRVISGMIYRIYLWLSVIFRYASANCARELDVFLYMTKETKRLPQSPTGIIDREHVNTAFTTSCQPKIEIHIFREEEWFKVFIHESFHCFGLDFSGMTGTSELGDRVIKDYYHLKGGIDLRIYEAYTEAWAEILYIFIYGFLQSKKRTWETVFRHFAKSLKIEQAFSIFQCCKVLSHNGLSYRNICARTMGAYNEKSHVFSYYILKSALLFHADDFIRWCITHNDGGGDGKGALAFRQTAQNIDAFCKLLVESLCQTGYLSAVSEIERRGLYHRQSFRKSVVGNTLRMTVHG
jgi:hypothetical protein